MSREPEFPSHLPPHSPPVGAASADRGSALAPVASLPSMPGLPLDLARLFRHSLCDGRLHPLMPLVLRYRRVSTADEQGPAT